MEKKEKLKTSDNGYWTFETWDKLTPEEKIIHKWGGQTSLEKAFSSYYGEPCFLIWVETS